MVPIHTEHSLGSDHLIFMGSGGGVGVVLFFFLNPGPPFARKKIARSMVNANIPFVKTRITSRKHAYIILTPLKNILDPKISSALPPRPLHPAPTP